VEGALDNGMKIGGIEDGKTTWMVQRKRESAEGSGVDGNTKKIFLRQEAERV